MKKLFSIKLVLALLLMAAAPARVAAVNQVSHTATYNHALMELGTDTVGGVMYTTVNYKGLFNFGTFGMPSLPVDLISFSVPYNATNFTVTTTPTVSHTRLLGHPVYPLQSPNGYTQPDASVYQNGDTYPAQSAWVVDEGMMAGENHVVTVAVLPWIYRHTAGTYVPDTLRVVGSMCITLSYELTDSPALQALIRKGASLREEGYVQTCAKVVNPENVRANAASAVNPLLFAQASSINDTITNPITYLIITTPQLIGSMKRLAALKSQEGMKVKIVTYSEAVTDPIAVGGDNIGDDDNPIIVYTGIEGKLRQYIRVHYRDYGTKYVLLAGTGVPSRDNSDMYYCSLHGDWINDKDYTPDLTVGRLLGSSTEQIDYYTDKLFRYELNPGMGNGTYLNDALVIETDTFFPQGEDIVSGLEDVGMDVTLAADIESDHEQLNLNPITGYDVVNLVNSNHYGFMGTACNGGPNHVRVNEANSEYYYLWANDTAKVAPGVTDTETGNGLNHFLNKDYPMAFYAASGRTMPYEPVQGYGNGLSFGESFTTGKDYGGPAFIGFTKDIDLQAALRFLLYFSNRIYPYGFNLSDVMAACRNYFDANNGNNEKINYLGDPSLKLWTDAPSQYTGIQLTRSGNAITVSGIPTGANNTVVAYCDNEGQAGQIETNSSSVTINNVSPNSTIMLYKHNYLPYIAPLLIQNDTIGNSQYVIADEVKMGKAVDFNRTQGAVTVTEGVNYEIEASGKVTLSGGFKVERGASFAVRKSCYK